MKIYIKKIDGVDIPKKGSPTSAGYDIISTSEPKIVGIQDGEGWRSIDYIQYETNLFIAPSASTFHTLIHPRSSVSKYNLVLANSIGLVDNDYRGMVICRFKYIWQPEDMWWGSEPNEGQSKKTIIAKVNENKIYKKGDAIAQLVFEETINADWEIVDDLNHTQRGTGGFGSTDSKVIVPKSDAKRIPLEDLYNQSGGIPIKGKYTEEIKNREQ